MVPDDWEFTTGGGDSILRAYDESTSYVEKPKDAKGRYTLDMSHFFRAADGTRTWQVGVGGYAPPATRADIQKIINDVLTQTG